MTLSVLLLPSALALPTPSHLRDADPDRDVFHALHARLGPRAAPPPADPEPASSWDVTRYTAHVRIDPADRTLVGTMTIEAARDPMLPAGNLLFHYTGGALGTVTVDGASVTPTSVDGSWQVSPAGDTTVVVITWALSGSGPDLGLQFDDGVTWSVDEPDGARTWLPVYDEPWDKAAWTWEIEAPSDLTVAANGTLTGTADADPAADGRAFTTWTWTFDQPIATYLVALHIADYQVFELGRDVPVTLWASPILPAQIVRGFANTPDMIDLLSADFGAYPWDHYGTAIVPFTGAMEHTTCTSFGQVYAEGNPDLVNVHELAHHWFGDDVTLDDWRDMWLNEGFAAYSEALWYEHEYGQEGLTSYVDWQRDVYYEWKSEEGDFSLYDPDYLFGGTVYEKGAWVVHMLRGLLGDEVFFPAVQDYVATYSYANASTSEFEASLEASTGEDLGWFFDGYVYGTGEPTIDSGFSADGHTVTIALESDTTMPLPVPVRVQFVDGSTVDLTLTLEDGSACERHYFSEEVSGLELDPDLWVLTVDRGTLTDEAVASCDQSFDSAPIADDSGAAPMSGAYGGAPGCACGTAAPGSVTLGALLGLGFVITSRRRQR